MVAGPTIDSQTLTYVQSVLETIPPVHPSLKSAIDAFYTSFNRWNPQVLADIGVNDKLTIDFLFSELTTTNNHLDAYTKNILSICQKKICTIVENWSLDFVDNIVPKDALEQLLLALEANTWDTYQNYAPENAVVDPMNGYNLLLLPTIHVLQVRIEEIGHEEQIVQNYLNIQIHGTSYSLKDLLSKHYCSATFTRMNLREYRYLANEDIMDASNVQRQLARIRYIFGPTPDIVYQLIYFSMYPSLIFGDVSTLLTRQNVATAVTAMKERNALLLQVFGSEMNFSSICSALQQHFPTNDDAIINKEITTILNCKVLKISALDITHFRAIRLLRDVKFTLQEFIDTCVLYKFDIVTKDPLFVTLEESVKGFYSADTNDRNTCISFIDQLFTVLCPLQDDSDEIHDITAIMKDPYISLLYKMHRLKTVCTSGIKLFSYVLRGPELWEFFRSMNWFQANKDVYVDDAVVVAFFRNNENLIPFYENYDALLYILQQHGATNEMVIIESLEPVVRLFNFVQQNEHVTTLHEVITNMENVHDIFYSDGADHREDLKSIVQNICDLDSRSESLKDLFYRICGNPVTTKQLPTK